MVNPPPNSQWIMCPDPLHLGLQMYLVSKNMGHTWALHIHKVGVGRLNKPFLFMLSSLMVNSRMKEIFSQL